MDREILLELVDGEVLVVRWTACDSCHRRFNATASSSGEPPTTCGACVLMLGKMAEEQIC